MIYRADNSPYQQKYRRCSIIMEITTNQLSLTGVIMENPQFDHEVFGEAFSARC